MEQEARKSKALLFTKRISADGNSRWLVDEFADQLVDKGYEVDVVWLSPKAVDQHDSPMRIREGVSVIPYSFAPFLDGKLSRFYGVRKLAGVLTGMVNQGRGEYFRSRSSDYDLVVMFSVASYFGFVFPMYKKYQKRAKFVFVLWDFFPVHHIEVGGVKRYAHQPLKLIEKINIQAADLLVLMSPKNLSFAEEYFQTSFTDSVIAPPWGEEYITKGQVVDKRYTYSRRLKLVFGGQMGRGRDLSLLRDFMRLCHENQHAVEVNLVGVDKTGIGLQYLTEDIDGESDSKFIFHKKMTRPDYLRFLLTCDAGLVLTQSDVSIPSFPSKVVDYAQTGLPVLACVESTTDFGEIVEAAGMGFWCVAGDPEGLLRITERLIDIKNNKSLRDMASASRRFFEEELNVSKTVDKVLEKVNNL